MDTINHARTDFLSDVDKLGEKISKYNNEARRFFNVAHYDKRTEELLGLMSQQLGMLSLTDDDKTWIFEEFNKNRPKGFLSFMSNTFDEAYNNYFRLSADIGEWDGDTAAEFISGMEVLNDAMHKKLLDKYKDALVDVDKQLDALTKTKTSIGE